MPRMAAFHSVSAFNNAGFDLNGNFSSLTGFSHDPFVLLVIAALIIGGGISVLVLLDMASKRSWRRLSPNSKTVLLASGALLAVGFISVIVIEFNNPRTIGSWTVEDKVTNAFFHSVTPRTAGFNSMDVSSMKEQTQLVTMSLMYIGGATGSTAGGIKVTTFAVLFLATLASVAGHQHARVFGRRFSHRLVYRALAIAALSSTIIFVSTLVLMISDPFSLKQSLFEVVSAFGTVGLTTGATPSLSFTGKITICVIMFLGRLGPLTIAYALARNSKEPRYELPERDVAIG